MFEDGGIVYDSDTITEEQKAQAVAVESPPEPYKSELSAYGGGGMNTGVEHKEIREQLREHEKRIIALEKTDAEFAIKLQNLIEKIDSLTGWIKALVVSLIGTGVGFIIWYLQSLPR